MSGQPERKPCPVLSASVSELKVTFFKFKEDFSSQLLNMTGVAKRTNEKHL
jgi:hypothetical protein